MSDLERPDETMRRAALVIQESLPDIGEDVNWYTAASLNEYVNASSADSIPFGDIVHMALWGPKVAVSVMAWLLAQAEETGETFDLYERQQQTDPDGTLVLQPGRTLALAVAKEILGENGEPRRWER